MLAPLNKKNLKCNAYVVYSCRTDDMNYTKLCYKAEFGIIHTSLRPQNLATNLILLKDLTTWLLMLHFWKDFTTLTILGGLYKSQPSWGRYRALLLSNIFLLSTDVYCIFSTVRCTYFPGKYCIKFPLHLMVCRCTNTFFLSLHSKILVHPMVQKIQHMDSNLTNVSLQNGPPQTA